MVDGMAVDCGSAAGTTCNYADPFAYPGNQLSSRKRLGRKPEGRHHLQHDHPLQINRFRGEYMYSGVLTKLQ